MALNPVLSPESEDLIHTDDLVLPFQIDRHGLRGRLVRLGPSVDAVLRRHAYPPVVAKLLGEAMAVAACLASSVKYDGVFTLQASGEGPVRMLVADVTSEGAVRGYVGFDPEGVAGLTAREPAPSVARLFGGGYLAFTVDLGGERQRYQGIVALEGASLADSVHHYFRQSEQIDTAVKVACEQVEGRWRAAALMVQRLPEQRFEEQPELDVEGDIGPGSEEGWHRAVLFLGTATTAEMLSPELSPRALLFRLFHEDGVRVFRPRDLVDRCRCDRQRVERVLRSLTREELNDCREVDGGVVVTCEFCSRTEQFSADQLSHIAAH